MEIRDMQIVALIVKEGSLTKASKKSFITQPAISKIVGRVEEEWGAVIFNRQVTPWQLTYAGEIFLKNANKIISIFNAANRQLESIVNHEEGKLTIAVTSFTERYLIPLILPFFRAIYPNFKIRLLNVAMAEIEDIIGHNVANFAIVALAPSGCRKTQLINVKDYDVLLAVPLSHPLAKGYVMPDDNNFPEIAIKDIAQEPLVLMKDGLVIEDAVRRMFQKEGLVPNVAFEVSTLEIAYYFVESGNGLSFIFDQQVNRNVKENKVAYFKMKDEKLIGNIMFGKRKDKELNEVENAFFEILTERA